MAGEIVNDHPVAGVKFRTEYLPDVNQECRAIHWTIENPRSAQTVMAQSRNKRGRLPVAMGNLRAATLADL
jgi:hypothetical protein